METHKHEPCAAYESVFDALLWVEEEWDTLENKRRADYAANKTRERGRNLIIDDSGRQRREALWARERALRKRLARAIRTADRHSRTEKPKNKQWALVSRAAWKTAWSTWKELKTFPVLSKHTKRILDDWKE